MTKTKRVHVVKWLAAIATILLMAAPMRSQLSGISGSPFVFSGVGSNSNVVLLSPDERFLFVSNQSSSSITALNVSSTGSLTVVTGSPFSVTPDGAFPIGMRTNLSGTYLFSTTLAGTVTVQSISSTGTLTQVGSISLGTSSFSLNGIEYVSKSTGDFLYLNNNVAPNTVTAFSVSGGVLTPITGSPFSTGGNGSGGSISAPRTSLCSANGYLFVMNSSSNNISVFSMNSNGSLSSVSGSPFPIGTTASGAIAVNPAGTMLFAGTIAGQIVVFNIAANGALSAVGSFSSGVASRVDGMVVHPNGNYLVTTHPSSNRIAVLSIAADGTLASASSSPFTGDGVEGGGPAGAVFNSAGTLLFVGIANFGSTRCSVYNFLYTLPNSAPLANAGPDQTVECTSDCTAPVTLNGSGSTDLDADTLSYSWSEAAASLGTGAILTRTFTKGNHTVVLTVNDGKGGAASDTVLINVVDTTPPIITCPANVTTNVNTGSCSAVVSYPAPTATDNCSVLSIVCSPASGSTFARGTTTVTCTAADESGNTSTCTFTVTVVNHAPVVGPITTTSAPALVNTPVNASAAFTDPDLSSWHTADWDWGDGANSLGTFVGLDSVRGSHTYSAASLHTVALTVRDTCGDQGKSTFQYVIVYDPNAGFVTGAGTFDSPEGAFRADSASAGKANFRFVSKYQKGSAVPTGNTEFQFKSGSLDFKGTSYKWMIVEGNKVQCAGEGMLNGSGNYGFLLTAIDGESQRGIGLDKVRMRIGNNIDSTLIFDNQLGASETAAPTATITGGSIVIHPVEPGQALSRNENIGIQTYENPIPHEYMLHQNYPNPFNPSTVIRYDLPEGDHVTLKVYDLLGQEVATLVDGNEMAGQHAVRFIAEQLPSGVYIYRLAAGSFVQTKKLMVVK